MRCFLSTARQSEKDDDEEEYSTSTMSVPFMYAVGGLSGVRGRSWVYCGHGVSIRVPFSWTWSSQWPPIKNSFAITGEDKSRHDKARYNATRHDSTRL